VQDTKVIFRLKVIRKKFLEGSETGSGSGKKSKSSDPDPKVNNFSRIHNTDNGSDYTYLEEISNLVTLTFLPVILTLSRSWTLTLRCSLDSSSSSSGTARPFPGLPFP
jgi:hypothetical protein